MQCVSVARGMLRLGFVGTVAPEGACVVMVLLVCVWGDGVASHGVRVCAGTAQHMHTPDINTCAICPVSVLSLPCPSAQASSKDDPPDVWEQLLEVCTVGPPAPPHVGWLYSSQNPAA